MIAVARLPSEIQIELWSKAPEGVGRGPCSSPFCRDQHCLDPRVTVTTLSGEPYTGPFVVLTFTWRDVIVFRVNGEDYRSDEWPIGRMHACLRRRYGDLAVMAFEHHITRSKVDEQHLN